MGGLGSPLANQVNPPGMAELPEPAAKRPARIVLVGTHSICQLDPNLLAKVVEGAVVQAIGTAPGTNQGVVGFEEIEPARRSAQLATRFKSNGLVVSPSFRFIARPRLKSSKATPGQTLRAGLTGSCVNAFRNT